MATRREHALRLASGRRVYLDFGHGQRRRGWLRLLLLACPIAAAAAGVLVHRGW